MWFGVISIMTEMIAGASRMGVFGRAIEQGIVSLELFDPRTHTSDRQHTVDDRPYGGGPGMVMKIEPLRAALDAAGTPYVMHMYEGVNHAFHNDTSQARYDAEAAELAWNRTLAFFDEHLSG